MYWRLQRWLEQRPYRRVFDDPKTIERYLQVRYYPDEVNGPVQLQVRQCPDQPLWCRPHTTDAKVLWDAFYEQYHRPPAGIRPTGWILDLGANVGYTAVDLANRYPQCRVLAVELDADNAAVFRRNTCHLGDRCVLKQAAIWSANGDIHYGGDEAWSLHVVSQAGPACATATAVAQACTIEVLVG